jgi:5-enolpyruvylshikimate-3-phosphate synthase
MGQNHRLNTRYIQRQMQALGNTCIVVEVTRTPSSEAYREVTETYITHTGIFCFVNILTEQDTSVQEGEARAGDLVFNFDYTSEAYLKQMNRIIFDGRTFQISDVRRFNAIGNTLYLIECLTKKYSDGTAWLSSLTEGIKTSDAIINVKT